MQSIPVVRTATFLCWLCLLLSTGCRPGGSGRDRITVRLDPGLASRVSAPEIELAVIAQDPNLIWSVVKLNPDYNSMNALVDKFLAAVDSSAVMQSRLGSRKPAVLDSPAPGRYWVLTTRLVTAGGERLLWSLPLQVDSVSTGGYELIMDRSNASLVLASDDSPL